jgi:anion-transporting  ArsA/GET3 family ATPase
MVRIYGGNQCPFSKRMSEMHFKVLREYEKEFFDKEIRVIPFFAEEIRGVDKLSNVINYLNSFGIKDAINAIEQGKTIE